MYPYFLILTIVTIFLVAEKYYLKRDAFWFPLLSLAIFAGIRNYTVGTDTINYTYNYDKNIIITNYIFDRNIEMGYQIYDSLILTLTNNYFWLLFLSAFFIVFSYLKFLKKFSIHYTSSVFIYISFGFYTFLFNGLRQALAIAIVLFAIPSLFERRLISYVLICLLASTFHTSALVMIPFYFILNNNLNIIVKTIILFFVSLLGVSQIINYISSTNERYESYNVSGELGGIYTFLFYMIIWVVVLVFNYKSELRENNTFKKFSEIYILGVIIVAPVLFLGLNPSGPLRILNYFTFPLIIIIPYIMNELRDKLYYFLFAVLSIVYFYLNISSFGDLMPYVVNNQFALS